MNPPVKKYSKLRDFIVFNLSVLRHILRTGSFGVIKDAGNFNRWWKMRRSASGTIDQEIPWLVFSAINFLDKWLQKDMKVFEYGSGGSTVFWSRRVEEVVSVEHDPDWYELARQHFMQKNIHHVKYILSEPVEDPLFAEKKMTEPSHCISSRKEYRGLSFEQYVKTIGSYPDEYFDLIVVDGRARTSCILYAKSKIKKGGFLLLDNAERAGYLAPFPELLEGKEWNLLRFEGHFPFAPASVLNKTYLFKKLG